jgi:V/A-type H+-transporting ATPase subunit D
MVDLDHLPLTRTTLLQLRRDLADARQGHALLERKREVLLKELWRLMGEVERSEEEVRRRFAAAYEALAQARQAMGYSRMRWAGLAPAAECRYAVESRSVMGVPLPLVQLEISPLPLPYSPFGVSVAFDEARVRWLEVGEVLGAWSETVGAVWKVAAELGKTRRRVSALETLVIPRYEAAIAAIESVLEEQEREGFVQAKRVKARQEAEDG